MIKFLKKAKFKFFLFALVLIFSNFQINQVLADSVQILKKINNEIITNIDIKKEYNYLVALNNNLKDVDIKEAYIIAEDSLVREKIKFTEIKKFFNPKNFKDTEVIDGIILNIIKNLNLNDKSEFEIYLNTYNLKTIDVEKKLIIEILWNQLIAAKYKNEINVDEKKILKKIKAENMLNKKLIEYDLSEIVFQAENKDDYAAKVKDIKKSISIIGFKNAASKYSIADTAKLGGFVGKIRENQLSDAIRAALSNIDTGQFTPPLNMGSSFIILFINQKKIIEEKIDEISMLNSMVAFEKNKQFENFSQIYFNKVKINTRINEF